MDVFFALAGYQPLYDHKLISKGVTLLADTAIFNQNIQDWQRLPVAQKIWQHFQTSFQQAQKELRKTVTTAGQGGYNAAVNNVYGSVIHQAFPQEQDATDNLGQIIQAISDQQNQTNKFSQVNSMMQQNNSTLLTTMNAMMEQIQDL